MSNPLFPARGETIEQSVESLQAVMAQDAELMQAQAIEIGTLKAKLNSAGQTITRLRKEIREMAE